MHIKDLWLACGCSQAHPAALAGLEALLREVGAFIAHIDRSADFADEVRQQLREKLLVDVGRGRARILDYGGQGPLGGWLRVAAVRTALNLKRGQREGAAHRDPSPATSPDPELDFIRMRYRAEFQLAFGATLRRLSSDERNVLRLHYLEGLNIDEIGRLYDVHRATIARWLARSRDKILQETRSVLAERLGLSGAELDSLIGLVGSQLEVSLRRLLPSD
jgi:RNA polymerase sigma-70 factor (ECF subfamily)